MRLYTFSKWHVGKISQCLATGETLTQAETMLRNFLGLEPETTEQLFNIKVEQFPVFKYCSYWGTWNRVLAIVDFYSVFEMSLTPINANWGADVWNKTKQELIRFHCTTPDKEDKAVDQLPDVVVESMVNHYGNDIAQRMISHDYLSEVTLTDIYVANNKSNGGGVPLQAIKDIRDGVKSFHHSS